MSKDALAIGSQPRVQPMLEDDFMCGAKRRHRMRYEAVQRFTSLDRSGPRPEVRFVHESWFAAHCCWLGERCCCPRPALALSLKPRLRCFHLSSLKASIGARSKTWAGAPCSGTETARSPYKAATAKAITDLWPTRSSWSARLGSMACGLHLASSAFSGR